VTAGTTPLDELRERASAAGFHVFLRPDRPSGWWVTLSNAADGEAPPTEARAATRDEAIALATRLFVNQRLGDLDRAIRDAGLQPPFWGGGGQTAHLEALEAFARQHDL
jgi:hypothetical protein